MQFWGVEVAKEPNMVTVEEGHVIHLSQVTLGELKKDNEPVTVHVKIGDKKFVLGILNQTTPQLSFDLVFDEEFEISHNWKNGSVHLLGYETELPEEDDDDMFGDDSDDEEEDLPTLQRVNGLSASAKPVDAKPEAVKPEAIKPKAAAKPAKDDIPKPQEKDDTDEDSDDDEDDSDSDSDSGSGSDEDMMNMSDDSDDNEEDDDDDDDDDDESQDEKPAKLESGKKRANVEVKTPETKKAKLATPQKSDGKKGAHTATPHPSKKGAKTPGSDKSTPKSGGQFGCEPCKKSFNSEIALQSHKKAKHGAK